MAEVSQKDFPSGPAVKNPPANAGDMGLIPGPRRFHRPWGNKAHVLQLLKPVCRGPMLCTREAAAMASSLHSPQLEKAQ